jgi:hypothetical protein
VESEISGLPFVTTNAQTDELLSRIGPVNVTLKLAREKLRRPWKDLDEWREMAAKADAILADEKQRAPGVETDDLARRARDRLLRAEYPGILN